MTNRGSCCIFRLFWNKEINQRRIKGEGYGGSAVIKKPLERKNVSRPRPVQWKRLTTETSHLGNASKLTHETNLMSYSIIKKKNFNYF